MINYHYQSCQYGKPAHEGHPPPPSIGGPKRVGLLFTLHHDLHEKEPKLQKATMMSMKVHVSSVHAPIYITAASPTTTWSGCTLPWPETSRITKFWFLEISWCTNKWQSLCCPFTTMLHIWQYFDYLNVRNWHWQVDGDSAVSHRAGAWRNKAHSHTPQPSCCACTSSALFRQARVECETALAPRWTIT